MKKKILLILVALLIFTTACGKKNSSVSEKNMKSDKYDYLVLVNKYSQLPDDWENNVELVDAKNAWDEDIKVEKYAYEQYKKLESALKEEGVTIELDSAYRSVAAQQELWDGWSMDPEKGIEYVRKFVAVPGYSEHHTGLAIDIVIRKDGKLIDDNDDMIAEREIFSKIHAKLADYGFILRYLENREESTGYTYEPWHLRYVGSKKIAHEIMDKNITLEEYLEKETDLINNYGAAKIFIEKLLLERFEEEYYKDQISDARLNITNIYTAKDLKDNEKLKDVELYGNDMAFEVIYQLKPKSEKDIEEIIIPNGEYDEKLGWSINNYRVGIIRQLGNGSYDLVKFSTSF